jgi:hypothetical protein
VQTIEEKERGMKKKKEKSLSSPESPSPPPPPYPLFSNREVNYLVNWQKLLTLIICFISRKNECAANKVG